MKRKKLFIYGLTILLTAYQASMGISMTAFAAMTMSEGFMQDKANGIYQADRQYEKWVKQNSDCVQGVKKWKKVNGKYQYPVTPYDKEWGNYTKNDEMYTACQIPREILDQLTTEELLELVLDCPQLIDIYSYNSIQEGVKLLAERFNGMNVLLSREDCLSVVSRYYSEYKIPKKQQLDYDALLPGDNPDYYIIVDNEELMRKAEEDAKVMLTLNLCEAVMEIASDENKMSIQEKQRVTKLILQKTQEKAKSECVEGPSTEEMEEDSLLNECRAVISGSSASKTIQSNTSRKSASKDTSGSFELADGGTVKYIIPASSNKIPESEIALYLNKYNQFYLTSGKRAVTTAGGGGTTAYNCYNFAWLKKYDPKSLWKKCTLNNDDAFCYYKHFTHANSPSSVGWVGSDGKHAVYVVKAEVSYVDSHNQVKSAPLVKSKWGASGPLLQHPVTLGNYSSSAQNMIYYC